jgi:hypothetical protein
MVAMVPCRAPTVGEANPFDITNLLRDGLVRPVGSKLRTRLTFQAASKPFELRIFDKWTRTLNRAGGHSERTRSGPLANRFPPRCSRPIAPYSEVCLSGSPSGETKFDVERGVQPIVGNQRRRLAISIVVRFNFREGDSGKILVRLG